MVEVFDFQKNFITGKETRKSKFKDNSMTKGVATIELFDKDNKLVEKTVSNNFITNALEGMPTYKWLSRMLEGKGYDTSRPINFQQFGQIQLRNGDFDEDPNTIFMRGDVVGWCPRTSTTSSTTDTTRGIYNASESFEEYTNDGYYHAHMVYDFLTSQGNGTINHVYWTPALYDNGYMAISCVASLGIKPSTTTYSYIDILPKLNMLMGADDNLYAVENSKYYKVQNKVRFLNGFENYVIDKNSPSEDFAPQNQRINSDYYVKFASSYKAGTKDTRTCNITLELVKAKTGDIEKTVNFDMINDFATMQEWSNSTNASNHYVQVQNVNFCTESGNVYMRMYVYGGNLPTVNADGSLGSNTSGRNYTICYNILKDVWSVQPNVKNYICYKFSDFVSSTSKLMSIKMYNDKHILFNASNQVSGFYILDENDFSVKSYSSEYYSANHHSNYSHQYLNAMIGIDYATNTMIGYYGTSNASIIMNRFVPYSSHTKLPSPVTKTNTTTMKVTYDYYIQVPNMFAEKGKEFDWGQE